LSHRLIGYLALVLVSTTTGCGNRVATPDTLSPQPPSPLPINKPLNPIPAVPPELRAAGAEIYQQFKQKWSKASRFQTELSVFSAGYYYGGNKTNEKRKAQSTTRLTFKRPSFLRAEVIDTSAAILKDATMVTTDMQSLRVKASGVLSLIPITMTTRDARLATNRNHYFSENNPAAHMNRWSQAGATWNLLSKTNNRLVLQLQNIKKSDPDIDNETLVLNRLDLSPVKLTMQDNGEEVVVMDFKRFTWDAKVEDKTFKL
jgi:outer membrane lipoprotein-sorting protein